MCDAQGRLAILMSSWNAVLNALHATSETAQIRHRARTLFGGANVRLAHFS